MKTMEIFIFRYDEYPYIGENSYDMFFAESLEKAISMRKETINESYCPSEQCKITHTKIVEGEFIIKDIYLDSEKSITPIIK